MKTSPAMPGSAARSAGHSISRKVAAGPMPSWLASRHWSAGTRIQRFEEQPRGQRQVEEDMRDEDAGQAVDAGPCRRRDRRQRRGQIAGAAEQREDAERRDDRRQRQRQRRTAAACSAATGKAGMARQRPRDEDRRNDRQHRRQQRLPQREAGDASRDRRRRRRQRPDRSRMPSAIKPGERPADQHGDGQPATAMPASARESTAERGGHCSTSDAFRPASSYRLIAASHSSTQALRFAATSSGGRAASSPASTSVSKAGFSGLSVGAGREHPVGLRDRRPGSRGRS